jgi:hypothetical protein
VPGGTQWQRAQQDPHALPHRFGRDDSAHRAAHALPQSEEETEIIPMSAKSKQISN